MLEPHEVLFDITPLINSDSTAETCTPHFVSVERSSLEPRQYEYAAALRRPAAARQARPNENWFLVGHPGC